jgi:hypothetical protein
MMQRLLYFCSRQWQVFFQSEEIAYSDFNGRWRAGFNFSKFRSKLVVTTMMMLIIILSLNLKLGTGFDFILDDFNKVALNVEFNKLLVPTFQKKRLEWRWY